MALVTTGCAPIARTLRLANGPVLTHGPIAGDPAPDRAVVWGRCDRPGSLAITMPDGRTFVAPTRRDHDPTAHVVVDGLAPGATYDARVRCVTHEAASPEVLLRVRTTPTADDPAPVRLAFGGDVAGQNVCRDRDAGFPTIEAVIARQPEVFVALGDLIYADDGCEPTGAFGNAQVPGPPVARDQDGYTAHWAYLREDPVMRRLEREANWIAVWDDHEIANDAGPYSPTFVAAREAFLAWNPVAPPAVDPHRLHRRVRIGRHLDLFVLDTRSHRDPNDRPDTAQVPKTMLGREQRTWLTDELTASNATWKVVVSSVPLAVPTGGAVRDGWANGGGATGFERELRGIIDDLRRGGITNVVVLTTDAHFASVARYRPFGPRTRFVIHEVLTGPMAAGLFPRPTLDPTLRPERMFFHGPADRTAIRSLAEARPWFSFGTITIDPDGAMRLEVVDGTGMTRWATTLTPDGD